MNIIGFPIIGNYNVQTALPVGKILDYQSGACVGLLDCARFFRLRLRGQHPDQTSLDPNCVYIIRANWSSCEKARWESVKARAGKRQPTAISSSVIGHDPAYTPPLIAEEKAWLKKNWGGEFQFLRAYGLSIYKEEDRDEGRRILRIFMEPETDSDDENDSLSSFQRDLEEDSTSHAADYHFTAKQLDYIKTEYGHSTNFLLSYGLKFYDDEDCEEGKAILEAIMEEDSDEDYADMPELV